LDFWVENKPSGNPAYSAIYKCTPDMYRYDLEQSQELGLLDNLLGSTIDPRQEKRERKKF
jgi:hypothetical protein